MLLLSHPTGNPNVRNSLQALSEAGLLAEFITTVATFDGNLFGLLSSLPPGRELAKRRFNQKLEPLTKQMPLREIGRILAMKFGIHFLYTGEKSLFGMDSIYRSIDKKAATRLTRLFDVPGTTIDGVYCYEDGALETFRMAKKMGLRTFYDLPTIYWRAAREMAQEESDYAPEWADTLLVLKDNGDKLACKDEELALADHVIVASKFSANSLSSAGVIKREPIIIPYGCEVPVNTAPDGEVIFNEEDIPTNTGPLKVLFIGQLTQRKGISYLFNAVEMLKGDVELTLVGKKSVNNCRALNNALSAYHRIPSLPHDQLLEFMRDFDVLVFPSLYEGFGLVITEALSMGLPVITTPNTCAPDIITDGVEGFIVPIRSSEAIANKLSTLHEDRQKLYEMKMAALNKAHVLGWENFHKALVNFISGALAGVR